MRAAIFLTMLFFGMMTFLLGTIAEGLYNGGDFTSVIRIVTILGPIFLIAGGLLAALGFPREMGGEPPAS